MKIKIETKILICFAFIILLIITRTVISYVMENRILDDTRQIKDVEAPLGTMSEQVIGYDAMLTGYARTATLDALAGNYSQTDAYETKYDEVGDKLDYLLNHSALALINESGRSEEIKIQVKNILSELNVVNLELVALEKGAFSAIRKKDPQTAYSLVMGQDYNKYKEVLRQDYQNWSAIELGETNSIRVHIINDAQQAIYVNFGIPIIVIIIIIVIMFFIRSFIKQEDNMFRLLYDSSKDALMTTEPPSWKFTSANPAALKLFNVKDEKHFMSLAPEDLSPEKQPDGQDSMAKARKMIEKAMEEGLNSFKWVHKEYKGRSFNAHVLLSRVEEGGKAYLQATVRKTD